MSAALKFLTSYWQPILSAIVTAIIAGIIGYGFHSHFQAQALKDKNAAVLAQKNDDTKQCNASKALNKETANDLEDAITGLNRQLDTYRLRAENPVCAAVVAGNAAGLNDGAAAGGILPGPDGKRAGLNPAWLVEYAGRCEKNRLQLIASQTFIRKQWAIFGQ